MRAHVFVLAHVSGQPQPRPIAIENKVEVEVEVKTILDETSATFFGSG